MNFYEEWDFPNLPSAKEIAEKYEKEVQLEFLNDSLVIPARENVFFALRRKYSILAQDSELVKELAVHDENSYATAVEILESFVGENESSINNYRESCLPSHLYDIQKEVSKDAITLDCLAVDDTWVEDFANDLNLFLLLRKNLLLNINHCANLTSILSGSIAEETDNDEDYRARILDTMRTIMDDNSDALIDGIIEGIIEGVSNFAVMLYSLIYRDKDFSFKTGAPRFAPALNLDEKRGNEATAILNNAVTLELDRENKLKLYFKAIDLNPVDRRNYTNIIKDFPDFIESICSTISFFAVPYKFDTMIEMIAKNKEFNASELEGYVRQAGDFFGASEKGLTVFREQYNENALAYINAKIRVLSNTKETTVSDAVSFLDAIESEIQKTKISLEKTEILPKIEAILTDILNSFAENLTKQQSNSYEICLDQIDKKRQQLKLQGQIVVSADQAHEIVKKEFDKKIIQYANTLDISNQSYSDCMAVIEKQCATYKIPFDSDLSHKVQVIIEDRINRQTQNEVLQANADLLNNPCNFQFKSEFIQHKARLQSLPVDPQIIAEHIAAVDWKMAEFDKQCAKAKRYQYIKDHGGLPLMNGDSKDMGIHYGILGFLLFALLYQLSGGETDMIITGIALVLVYCGYMFGFKVKKEKEVWNQLTKNGMYRFQDVINDNASIIPPPNP